MLYNIYCRPFFQFAFLQLPSRGSPLTLSNIDRILKMKTAAASVAKQGRRNRRGRPPPQVFGRTVNPILPRGQIMPTTVLRAPPPSGFSDLATALSSNVGVQSAPSGSYWVD